jgi:hypothetical protein
VAAGDWCLSAPADQSSRENADQVTERQYLPKQCEGFRGSLAKKNKT